MPQAVNEQEPKAPALEKHYSLSEIAQRWGLSEKTVRRMFEDEAGVLRWGRSERTGKKRSYVSLRVPESVLIRIHQRMRIGA